MARSTNIWVGLTSGFLYGHAMVDFVDLCVFNKGYGAIHDSLLALRMLASIGLGVTLPGRYLKTVSHLLK